MNRQVFVDVMVGSSYRLWKWQIPANMLEQLKIRFTYGNPEPVAPGGQDNEWTRPSWCAVTEDATYYYLPRGLLEALRNCAEGCGVTLRFVSQVAGTTATTPWPLNQEIKLRPYQKTIVDMFVAKVQGYVVLPCGGGKTTAGVAAIFQVGQPALVLVGNTDLLDQWAKTIDWAGGGFIRARRLGGAYGVDLSPLQPGEVAVAMVQSLYQRPGVEKFLESAAVVLTDEAHHIAARQWKGVVNLCPARWRWGLTATPERADGWGFLLRVLLGPCLYQETAQQLVRWGFLLRPSVIPVFSGWQPSPAEHWWLLTCPTCKAVKPYSWAAWKAGTARCTGKVPKRGAGGKVRMIICAEQLTEDVTAVSGNLDWSKATSALGAETPRLILLARLAAGAVATSRKVLVLVGRKSSLMPLAVQARTEGVGQVAVVSSEVAKREKLIEDLRAGKLNMLGATQVGDEGLDIPDLDCIILGQPGKDGGKAKQRAGRSTRPEGRSPVVFDVVDGGKTFKKQWHSRRAAYEAEYGAACIMAREPVSIDEALRLLRAIK